MPGRCETCNNPIGKDGSCTKCDTIMGTAVGSADMSSCVTCRAAGKICDGCKREEGGNSITKLQEAKSRIRGAPSRSGSGAEPPAFKKPTTEETPPSPTLPKNEVKDPILLAIMKLTEKVDQITIQNESKVSKKDLEEMQVSMEKRNAENTKIQISSAVDPIKDNIFEMHARLEKI